MSCCGSIRRRRIKSVLSVRPDALLPPIAGLVPGFAVLAVGTSAYLDLVDWTARQTRRDKRGRIDAAAPRIIATLGLGEAAWSNQMLGIESRYARAVGSVQSLIDKAAVMGQQWLKGIAQARRLQRLGA